MLVRISGIMILYFIFTISLSAQTRKDFKWCVSLSINSIPAQIEVPIGTSTGGLSTGIGAMVIDGDGNILGRGKREDNSFSFSLHTKYRINEDILLRAEFGITTLKAKAYLDITSLYDRLITKHHVELNMQRFTFGFQWAFLKEKRIESYCGMFGSFQNFGSVKVRINQETRNALNDTIQSFIFLDETTPGGFSTGIGALVGFGLFLNKHISIGAELSSVINYYKLGGDAILDNTGIVQPDFTYNFQTTYNNSFTGIKVSKIMSSFNVSYWF